MKTNYSLLAAGAFCSLLATISLSAAETPAASAPAAVAPAAPLIDPEAARLLQAVSTQLSSVKAFTFKAEIWEDIVVADHKVSTTRTVETQLRRPDRLQIEVRSPRRSRGFWYDGKSLTLLSRTENIYGTIPVPDTIDKVLDAANDQFGINLPLEDVLAADLYASATEGIKGGVYFGKVTILGKLCQHIAFSTDAVDWQLWIEGGAKPLIKKLVITYKNDPTAPQFTALFSEWNLSVELADKVFEFTPPKDAVKVEVLPASDN